MEYELRVATSPEWVKVAKANFDTFLKDHAACERKAAALAMSMVQHYPDKPDLIRGMIDLAMEEMAHFREVMKIMLDRGLQQDNDEKDPYIKALLGMIRKDGRVYLLDRLLIFSIVEKRGHERFMMMGESLEEPKMKDFYVRLAKAEYRHYTLFVKLAHQYYDSSEVLERLDELLDAEAKIVKNLPFRAAVH
ncbi:tRNA-(ms[2]io[6]A)-hydroxylase [Marinicella sp. S1101]|uniref:tRNA-(ms[2]io[6]A)-hydroxylase n=1 Tax=Marinicella marina TaxID=2996016 RepID=UPI002260FAC0|nr:tRNA-(ms[2]io[6]A)-hydroxylase [Marinicella marina]MCX7554883.1 tRNA-(ms[2]io[6]A)-hydroxylase [Marinicella marina]MDJ1141293.1 tRNA-(ms[2]io[6]A)-hydroxylase [Marinicella marina]